MEESRLETLLNALIKGETIDFEPQSRMEEYLKNCINKAGVEGLPTPQSRVDALLYSLADKLSGSGGGGSSEPTMLTATDGRTSLMHWFQGLESDIEFTMDWDTYETFWAFKKTGERITEFKLAHPSGTQNIINVSSYTKIYLWHPENDSLDEIPLPITEMTGTLDLPNIELINGMFSRCSELRDLGDIRFGNKLKQIHYAFSDCNKLTRIPVIDMRNTTSALGVIGACASMEQVNFKNIGINLQVGSGTLYGHLLTVDSLINLIYELRDTGSSKTLTVGNANLEKLANVYVKTIEITDEMRTADDLVDEKLPFVVCESTDEGAIPIADYVIEKNWTLK
jgi:hypothetical protein